MFRSYYRPHLALTEYVENVWMMGHEFSLGDPISPIYTYMPTHTRFLCFYLEDQVKVKKGNGVFEERAKSIIIGPQLTPVTLDLGKKHADVIVVLKPCGLYRLLGIPQREIVDCDFDAGLILGKDISYVTEQLMNTRCNEKRNDIIQSYLLRKLINLKPALPFDRAMLQLVNVQGNLSMDFLASQSCLSVRQMERQSLERIGLSPKYFARMVRFSEAYKCKERNPYTSWIDISARFGYYDQMHLIRDFRHFTGYTPSFITTDQILGSVKFNSLEP